MRNRIKAALLAAIASAAVAGAARAHEPSVADLDAAARAVGNRRDVAERIGRSIFATEWAAEVSQISANEVDGHLIVGIRVWGVKFHAPMTRAQFVGEVAALVGRAFSTEPAAEEVDLWASVPIAVAKGAVVSGDLAKPTSRTVFSVTALRGEPPEALQIRVSRGGEGVFWDPEWTHGAFKDAS